MKQTVCLLVLSLALLTRPATAQLGMGGQPHPSAALDLKATDKAFYPPRLTSAQRVAIASPQPGAMVFDTDKGRLYLHDGQNWYPLPLSALGTIPLVDRLASDGTNGNSFGRSVAIDGNYAVIGAYGFLSGQGKAYVFVRTGNAWTEQAILTLPNGAAYDSFGGSVALSGDYLLVGASDKDVNGNTDQGAAYLYQRSGVGWSFIRRITDDSPTYTFNGGSVGISNGSFIISGSGFQGGKGKVAFGTVDSF